MSWRARAAERPNHPRMRTPSRSSQFQSAMPRSGRLRVALAVEAFAPRGHVAKELRHLELLAILARELVALGHELPHADLVDQADRPAGLRREAQAHDRADVAVLRVCQNVGFEAARGVDRLHVEQPLLDLGLLRLLLLAL